MKAEIDVTPPYGKHLLLDGFDVAKATKGFDLKFSVGDLATLTLDLIFNEKTTAEGEVIVEIPERTREALIHIGWTPPAA